MSRHRSLSAAALLLLLATFARAHSDALSLEEAVALAVQRAPQLEVQAAALDAVQAESIAAGRLPDPELVVGVDNLPATGPDAWSFDRDFMTMRKVGVMQNFPNGRKRASQRERAAASESVARAETEQTKLEVERAAARRGSPCTPRRSCWRSCTS